MKAEAEQPKEKVQRPKVNRFVVRISQNYKLNKNFYKNLENPFCNPPQNIFNGILIAWKKNI